MLPVTWRVGTARARRSSRRSGSRRTGRARRERSHRTGECAHRAAEKSRPAAARTLRDPRGPRRHGPRRHRRGNGRCFRSPRRPPSTPPGATRYCSSPAWRWSACTIQHRLSRLEGVLPGSAPLPSSSGHARGSASARSSQVIARFRRTPGRRRGVSGARPRRVRHPTSPAGAFLGLGTVRLSQGDIAGAIEELPAGARRRYAG